MSLSSVSSPTASFGSKRQCSPSRNPFACDTVDLGTWSAEGTGYVSYYHYTAETTHGTAARSTPKNSGPGGSEVDESSFKLPTAVKQANGQVLRRLDDLNLKRNELVERQNVEGLKKMEELLERCMDL